jgi:hypothetical protein
VNALNDEHAINYTAYLDGSILIEEADGSVTYVPPEGDEETDDARA